MEADVTEVEQPARQRKRWAVSARLQLPGFLLVVAAVFVCLPLMLAGSGLTGSLVAVRLSLASVDPTTVGLVLAQYSLGFVLGGLYAARIIARVGHIRAFSAFAALTTCFTLAYPVFEVPLLWALWRAGSGATLAGMISVVESWLAARATRANRGRLMSVYMLVSYAAGAGGQMLLAVTGVAGFVPFTGAAMLIVLSLVPVVLGNTEAPPPQEPRGMPPLALYRAAPLGVLGALFAGQATMTFITVGPYYATQLGMEAAELSVFMAAAVFSGLLLQVPTGYASDRWDRLGMFLSMTAATLVAAVLATAASLAGYGTGMPGMLLASLYMACAATLYPQAAAITNDNIQAEVVVPASASLLAVWGLGAAAGPIAATFAMRSLGPPGLFAYCSATMAGLLLVGAWRMRAPRVPEEQRGAFVSMPAVVTPVSTALENPADAS